MGNRQKKIARNVGKDTHVRDHGADGFRNQATSTFQMLVGEVEFTEPEPIFKQNMVTVSLARGGRITSVAYPGAFIEPVTGNMHGMYEGPFPGQMVMVGFENGNMNNPFVVNKYPYQGNGNSFTEYQYITPLTRSLYDSTDVIMGHFTGSYISLNTGILSGNLPGSISVNAMTDFNVNATTGILLSSLLSIELSSQLSVSISGGATVDVTAPATTISGDATAEITAPLTTISASTAIELNGNTNFAVKYTELKTAFDLLRTELNNLITIFNAHIHIAAGPPGAPIISPTATPGIPATADMTASQNLKVLM